MTSPIESARGQIAPSDAPAQPPRRSEVVPHATKLSASEAKAAISSAWTQKFGSPPSAETLGVLAGQWALETGHGASMMNFNFGGIKGTGPSGLTTAYGTDEGYGATKTHITDHFRAYASASEGAKDYLNLLASRYPDAVSAAKQGDPQAFVHALKQHGYFTGSEAAYTSAVTKIGTDLGGVPLASHIRDFGGATMMTAATASTDVGPPAAPGGLDFADRLDEASLRIAEIERESMSGSPSNADADATDETRTKGHS